MKKISVIIRVYNSGNNLENCIKSLMEQSYRDFTTIIINDGSKDNSKEIIEKYSKKKPNLFKVFNTKNIGVSACRNKGIKNCTTEFFTFLDAEDTIDKDYLLRFMHEMDKDTDIVLCDCKLNNRVIKMFDKHDDLGRSLMISNPNPRSKIYRTKLFKENKLLFDESINLFEDLSLLPIVGMYTNKIKYIEEPLYYSTEKIIDNHNQNINDIFKVMELLDDSIRTNYREELEYLYIEHLLRTSSLRYIDVDNSYIKRISDIMHTKFPNYKHNKYLKEKSFKFKLVCLLAYNKNYSLLKLLKKIRG